MPFPQDKYIYNQIYPTTTTRAIFNTKKKKTQNTLDSCSEITKNLQYKIRALENKLKQNKELIPLEDQSSSGSNNNNNNSLSPQLKDISNALEKITKENKELETQFQICQSEKSNLKKSKEAAIIEVNNLKSELQVAKTGCNNIITELATSLDNYDDLLARFGENNKAVIDAQLKAYNSGPLTELENGTVTEEAAVQAMKIKTILLLSEMQSNKLEELDNIISEVMTHAKESDKNLKIYKSEYISMENLYKKEINELNNILQQTTLGKSMQGLTEVYDKFNNCNIELEKLKKEKLESDDKIGMLTNIKKFYEDQQERFGIGGTISQDDAIAKEFFAQLNQKYVAEGIVTVEDELKIELTKSQFLEKYWTAKIKERNVEYNNLVEKYSQLQAGAKKIIEETKLNLKNAEENLETEKEITNHVKNNLAQATDRVKIQNDNIKKSDAQILMLENENTLIKNQKQALEEYIGKLGSNGRLAFSEINKKNIKIIECEDKIKDLNEQIEALKSQAKITAAKTLQAQKEIVKLKDSFNLCENNLKDRLKNIDILEKKIVQVTNRANTSELALQECKNKVAKLENPSSSSSSSSNKTDDFWQDFDDISIKINENKNFEDLKTLITDLKLKLSKKSKNNQYITTDAESKIKFTDLLMTLLIARNKTVSMRNENIELKRKIKNLSGESSSTPFI